MRRRVVNSVVASAIAFVFGALLWSTLVSAQDAQGPALNPAGDSFTPQNTPLQDPAAPRQDGAPPADPSADAGTNPDPNTEVLTRGAIHEAFAQPVVFNASPTTVVPQKPPEAIEEMPPEQKPAGDHVTWIPGYWSWEHEQQKFIWTSGIWRAMPAGVEWVPGYWADAEGGCQWVCGFWRKNDQTEVTYLPQKPPDTLEQGQVGAAPGPNYVWIPGVWIWRGDRYAWRAGYWAACNPDWIWVPAHYVWTPSGYLFVDGHWDYTMERRGMIFAPVVFRPGVVVGAGYVYTPAIAMDFGVCTGCLFCHPGFGCYCFGDYYGPAYVGVGIYPWFAFHRRFGYDPVFAYYNWHYGPAWHNRMVVDYRFRIDHFDARPPRTFVAMRGWGGGPAFAMHINVFVGRGGGGGMHFERVSAMRRAEIHRAIRAQRVANEHRLQAERANAGRGGGPIKANLPKSAVAPGTHMAGTQQHANPSAGRQPAGRQPAGAAQKGRGPAPNSRYAPRSTSKQPPKRE